MTILNMQHTLTPFLIRALSKTEGEKKDREEKETDREREGEEEKEREKRGQTGVEEYEGKGGGSRVCCIDFLAVWHRP